MHARDATLLAAEAFSGLPDQPLPDMFVGFDGFLDSIFRVVDARRSPRPGDYDRLSTLTAFGERIAATSGRSTNIELDLLETRFGGNGPLMAGALGRLGFPTTYVGAVGRSDDPAALDPAFIPFAERCREVIPIAAPGLTDAYEFEDGRINFNKPGPLRDVTPERLLEAVGRPRLLELLRRSRIVAVVNWTLVQGVDGILDLLADLLVEAGDGGGRLLFFELSAAARRPLADIAGLLERLARLRGVLPVAFGMNRAEAERIAQAAGLPRPERLAAADPGTLVEAAGELRELFGVGTAVIHVRAGSCVADAASACWIPTLPNPSPVLQTGAGDHFNAGFAAGLALALPLPACAAAGNAVAGAYVSGGGSPTPGETAARLRAVAARL